MQIINQNPHFAEVLSEIRSNKALQTQSWQANIDWRHLQTKIACKLIANKIDEEECRQLSAMLPAENI